MQTTVTIKTRTLVLAVLVMLAVLGAYFVGSAGPGSSTAAAAANESAASADSPTIVMTGTGESTGVPDQLVFAVTIAESASDVSSALDAAGNAAHRVLTALNGVGIAKDDVQTTGLSVRPQYDYSGSGSPVLTGYGASESLSIVVRSLPDAGEAITAAVEAGGNAVRLHDVRLKIGDVDALLAKARDAAVAEAKDKAQQYADATSSELGAVVSVRELSASPRIAAPLSTRAFAADAASSVPIRAGSEELKVTVSIVWSLG